MSQRVGVVFEAVDLYLLWRPGWRFGAKKEGFLHASSSTSTQAAVARPFFTLEFLKTTLLKLKGACTLHLVEKLYWGKGRRRRRRHSCGKFGNRFSGLIFYLVRFGYLELHTTVLFIYLFSV